MEPIVISIPKSRTISEFDAPLIGNYGGDYCYAAPFLARAALDGNVICRNLNPASEQSGKHIVNILKSFGALVKRSGDSLQVSRGPLAGAKADISECPRLSSLACILGLFAKGRTRVTGFHGRDELAKRLYINLKKLGARCELGSADIWVWHSPKLDDAVIVTGGDVYMAMAFIMLSGYCAGEITVRAPRLLIERYPDYLNQISTGL